MVQRGSPGFLQAKKERSGEPFMKTAQEQVSCRGFEGFGDFSVTGTDMETGDGSFSYFLAEKTAGQGCSGRFQGFTEIIKNAKTDEETGDQIFLGESEREIRVVNYAGKMAEESFTGGCQVSMDVKRENSTAKMDERKFHGDLGGNSDGKTIERRFYGGSKRIYASEAADRRASGGFQSLEGVRNGNSSVGRRFSGRFGRELHTADFDGNMDGRALPDRFKTLTKANNENSDVGFVHGSESDEVVNLSKIVHSQVRKIREEDSHLGEDIGEGGFSSTKEKLSFLHLSSHMKNMLYYSRPILPSPLGTKTTIHSFR